MADFCTCDEFLMDDQGDSFGFIETDAPFPLPVELGGTGADNIEDALANLGISDLNANVDIALDELKFNNNFNLLATMNRQNLTYNGLTYVWSADGSCHVSGTVSGSSSYVIIFNNTSAMPEALTAGKSYTVKYSATKVRLRIWYYDTAWHSLYDDYADTTVAIPAGARGLRIQLITLTNGTVVDETVRPMFFEIKSEKQKTIERDEIGAASSIVLQAATGNQMIEMIPGGYIPCNTLTGINVNTVTTNANYRHAAVACTEGDVFTVSAKGASVGRAWAFVSANGDRLDSATAAQTVTNLVLTAPANTAWLIINDNNTDTHSYYGQLLKDAVDNLKSTVDNAGLPYLRPAANLAYSWWVKNRAVGTDGTLYFTYISQDAKAGVGCRYADGTIRRKDLYDSSSCDDHNAPGVVLINDTVVVIGPKGHNASPGIFHYVATEPNTIECEFTGGNYSIQRPTGYDYANSYAQVFTANGIIYDVFRVKQSVTGSSTVDGICWVCAKSSDFGVSWEIYRLFRIDGSKLDYLWLEDVAGSDTLKRIIVQRNTSATPLKPIRSGFVDLATNVVYDNSMTDIQKPMLLVPSNVCIYVDSTVAVCAEYEDFTQIIQKEEGYRIRVLDVWNSAANDTVFLYARTAVANDQTDFILYKYNNGTSTAIAHLGRPFSTISLYVTGACFCGDENTVVYSKNDSDTNDGKHSLHMAHITNGAVDSDIVLKRSAQLIARPARYDDGGVMYLTGKYNETTEAAYTLWTLSAAFL